MKFIYKLQKVIKLRIAILSIFILWTGCAGSNILRTDGLYQSTKVDNYYHYLRFYADSTVISTSSTGNPENLKNWFNRENENISIGKYHVRNDSVIFESINQKGGSVLYSVKVNGNRLNVYWKSLINNHVSNKNYKFRMQQPTTVVKNP